MKEIYITHAKRTPIGSFLGSLSTISAPFLGAEIIKNIIAESASDHQLFDEVILGQVLTGGSGQNPARQSALQALLPVEIPALTVNKVCGSGLKSIALAANAIKSGEGNLIIAGGQENMSLAMHGNYIRTGRKFGDSKFIDFIST